MIKVSSLKKNPASCRNLSKKAQKVTKLADKDFWRILRENGALYARTARAIETKFGISYSRQAVRERAEKNPAELADIEEENTDIAEEVVFNLFKSEDERVQADIAKFYLKTKAKHRGYIERSEITGKDGEPLAIRVIEPDE